MNAIHVVLTFGGSKLGTETRDFIKRKFEETQLAKRAAVRPEARIDLVAA